MKFGLNFQVIRPSAMIEIAQAAEAAGFESLWRPDHLVLPSEMSPLYPYNESGKAPIAPDWAILEPFTVFGYLASVTNTIKFGTAVYILPLRNPFVTAKALMTADRLTHGRILFGVGVGWWKEEFEAVGEDYKTRGARTDEYIKLIRTLCSQAGEITFDGKFVHLAPSRFEPKSIQQPAPPFHIGGESDAALRRVARIGDGWYGVRKTPEEANEYIAKIKAYQREYGREDVEIECSVSAPAEITPDEVRAYEEAGIHRLVIGLARTSADAVPRIEWFRDTVLSRL